MTLPRSFFEPTDDGRFLATAMAMGPWDPRYLHGGPPSALLVGALERLEGHTDFLLAQVTITFHRPVPFGPLRVDSRIDRAGRTVQSVSATLADDRGVVLSAVGLRSRIDRLSIPQGAQPWPEAESLERFVFPFFQADVSYHRAVDIRIAGGTWGTTPIRCWARSVIPLVEGTPTSGYEHTVILADAQSGMGTPLPPSDYSYVNPNLAVYFARAPEPGWLGLSILSIAGDTGGGLSQSRLRDGRGWFGGAAQNLIVRSMS